LAGIPSSKSHSPGVGSRPGVQYDTMAKEKALKAHLVYLAG
jgi:hypothetical protein